jgi:hypothetical protein
MPSSSRTSAIKANTRKEIAASDKAANAAYKKPGGHQPAQVKDAEQQLLEARRKIAALEKRLAQTGGGAQFLIESPVLHDPAAWAQLNNGQNAKRLRAFMLPKYLQVHGQPMVDPENGRTKKILGGQVELIKGRGEFESEDWARYLSLNFPNYVISRKQADGSYQRFVYTVEGAAPQIGSAGEEFYFDELPQTARTLAALNPNAQLQPQPAPIAPAQAAAAAPTRPQAQMPQALKDRLAAAVAESDAPVAVLTGA